MPVLLVVRAGMRVLLLLARVQMLGLLRSAARIRWPARTGTPRDERVKLSKSFTPAPRFLVGRRFNLHEINRLVQVVRFSLAFHRFARWIRNGKTT